MPIGHWGALSLGMTTCTTRLVFAWASALMMTEHEAVGLVHIPNNPVCELHRDDQASINAFFQRASYLCKADTKQYGNGRHGFGSSRL